MEEFDYQSNCAAGIRLNLRVTQHYVEEVQKTAEEFGISFAEAMNKRCRAQQGNVQSGSGSASSVNAAAWKLVNDGTEPSFAAALARLGRRENGQEARYIAEKAHRLAAKEGITVAQAMARLS